MWCRRRIEDISWTDRVKNKYYKESRRKGASYIRQNPGKLMGLVTYCLGTVLRNMLLKKRQTGRKDEDEDLSSCWMTLRK
jgi:hypothetical protein